MPAQAGIHIPEPACVPAFAGMTVPLRTRAARSGAGV